MIVFISNFVSPHVIPLCDELYRQSRGQFKFIETRQMSIERQNLGYKQLRDRKFVITYEEFSKDKESYQEEINKAGVVMASFGSIDNNLLMDRVRNDKLTFLLSERMFKKGILKLAQPRFWKNLFFLLKIKHKNFHLLCMGAYVALDFTLCGFNRERMWKFGYITSGYDDGNDCVQKKENKALKLLWVGRMVWWKRPFQVIKAAKMLHERGYDFTLDVVGGGKLENKVKAYIEKTNLAEITYHGLKKNDEVKEMMQHSDILICTSNQLEGWGAVINEGMNAGCVVVASEQMGATPYLITNGVTGYSYSGGVKALFQALTKAFKRSRIEINQNAQRFIRESWGADIAAQRLLGLISSIQQKKEYKRLYDSGICSKA